MGRYDDENDAPKKPRFRLMHVTLVMLSLLLVSKVTEVATATKELLSVRDAQAASEEPEEEKPEEKVEEKPSEDTNDKAEGDDASASEKDAKDEGKDAKKSGDAKDKEAKPKEEKTLGAGKLTVKEVEALKAQGAGSAYSQSEMDLLQNLTKRRNELDEREKEIELKSKVLDAAELRITSKVDEMKALQTELTRVVAEYKQQQDGEVKSLVKIYENMKPLDAAAIFNEMDMPILLEVIDNMSERKVAPVLAGMDPKRARDVTQELAEMRRGRSALNAAAADATRP